MTKILKSTTSDPERGSMAIAPTLTETTEPVDLLVFLHDDVKLTDREIALVAGAHEVTVRRWRSPRTANVPTNNAGLDDLRVITGLLLNSGVMRPEQIALYLRHRNAELDQKRPLELLTRGEFERVLKATQAVVDRVLLSPAPADDGDVIEPPEIQVAGRSGAESS